MQNVKKYKILIISFLAACCLSIKVNAATSSPVDFLQNISDKMISELKANQATLKTERQKVFTIVNRILLPNVDMNIIARSVVGREAWKKANKAEQEAFIKQFTNLLIHTYASALASYTDEVVEFYPIRGGWQNETQVEVNSKILQQGGPVIPMSYRLVSEKGNWKVIDFSVDGVSLIENFRAQFTSDLNNGGLVSLTEKLAKHNEDLAK